MVNNGNHVKALNPSALDTGIVTLPKPGQMRYVGAGQWLARFASQADDAPHWYHAHAYDNYTEGFWPTEPFLASAIGTVAAQYSARTWFVDGPPRIVKSVLDMLASSDNGAGMVSLFLKLIQDLKTRNNGAFLGIVRENFDYSQISSVSAIEKYKPGERALMDAQRGGLGRVVTLQHLDSTACYRTGNPLYPVLYRDPLSGNALYLPWHIVVPMAELPFPNVRYGGIQLSAVARVLRASQIMAAHEIYKLEKLTGRSPDELVLLNGLNRVEAEDQLTYDSEKADNQGLLRWQDKAVLFGVNPDKPASGQVLSTKSDGGFSDLDKELQWYITVISMGLLETYQTFAPLQAGGLGNSQQSIMLFESAQGKGPALWEKSWVHLVHQYAIIPRNCTWRWGEKSIRYETDLWTLINTQLDAMIKMQRDLSVPTDVIYQIMADKDIVLTDEYLAMLGERDQTADITVGDDEQLPDVSEDQDLTTPPTLDDIIAGRVSNVDAGSVQAQALNGAQVSSLLEIVGMYTSGALSLTSAQAIIAASFPFLSAMSITAILSKGDLAAAGIAVEPREVEQISPLKALSILRKGYKASEAEGLISEFSDKLHEAVNGYLAGEYGKARAQGLFVGAIESTLPQLAELGYENGGGDWAEADEDDTTEDETGEQVAYALKYWGALPDIKSDDGTPDARTDYYVQTMRGVYNDYKLRGAKNKMLTWNYGDTDHCATCADLNGQRHSARWFTKRGYIPQESGSETLDCKGFNCQCYLTDDEGEVFSI